MAGNVEPNSEGGKDEVLLAARELVEALRRSPRVATMDAAALLRSLAAAQRHVDSSQNRDWPSRLSLLLRDPPAEVNPFASPEFFVRLYNLWLEVRLDSYGIDEQGRQRVFFSDDEARQAFKATLAAIQESVPRRSRGRCPVGWFEADRRRRIEKEAQRVTPFLKRILEDVGRPTEYDSPSAFEAAIRESWTWLHLREAVEVLWHYRTKRGTPSLLKAARRLAKVLCDLRDEDLRSNLRSNQPLLVGLSEPRPRKRRAKS